MKNEARQEILDGIPLPIFFKDMNGVYTGCNKEFCTFLGREKDKIVGRTVHDLALPDMAKKYEKKVHGQLVGKR